MLIRVAEDAVLLAGVRAQAGPVFFCAVSALVDVEDALVHEVVPALALEASDGLLLDLLYVCPVVVYHEAVSYGPICSLSIYKRNDKVSSFLPR